MHRLTTVQNGDGMDDSFIPSVDNSITTTTSRLVVYCLHFRHVKSSHENLIKCRPRRRKRKAVHKNWFSFHFDHFCCCCDSRFRKVFRTNFKPTKIETPWSRQVFVTPWGITTRIIINQSCSAMYACYKSVFHKVITFIRQTGSTEKKSRIKLRFLVETFNFQAFIRASPMVPNDISTDHNMFYNVRVRKPNFY